MGRGRRRGCHAPGEPCSREKHRNRRKHGKIQQFARRSQASASGQEGRTVGNPYGPDHTKTDWNPSRAVITGQFSACDAVPGSGIPPRPTAAHSLIGTIDVFSQPPHRHALLSTVGPLGRRQWMDLLRRLPAAAATGIGRALDRRAVDRGCPWPTASGARGRHAPAAAHTPGGCRRRRSQPNRRGAD